MTLGAVKPYSAWEIVQTALPALSDGKNITPFRAVARFFDKVELRTEWTPPISFDMASIDEPGPPNPYGQALKPTMTFTGPAGTYTVAPYGEASRQGGVRAAGAGVGTVVGLLGAGFVLGKLHTRWKERRARR